MIDRAELRRRIEPIHLDLLVSSEEYRALLSATRNENAVEGSLFADQFCAAQMIRDEAAKRGDNLLPHVQLVLIGKALTRVLAWYGPSRRARRLLRAEIKDPKAA